MRPESGKYSKARWRRYWVLREEGWAAKAAHEFCVLEHEWDHAGGYVCGDDGTLAGGWRPDPEEYPLRLRCVPDEFADIDNLKGTMFDPEANPGVQESRLEREEREFEERVEREGVWGIIGEYWDGEEWVHADSCFGYIGDEVREPFAQVDIMAATLEAWRKLEVCEECGRPRRAS